MKPNNEIYKDYFERKYGPTADTINSICVPSDISSGNYISPFEIEKVIVSNPAVIILWRDKTKTVVKCQDDDYWDVEKAIAMCFVKKALGNKGNYYNYIRNALDKCEGGEECKSFIDIVKTMNSYNKLKDKPKIEGVTLEDDE